MHANVELNPRRVVAIIPARGGSKGIPGKNLMKVGGVSLVARAVASGIRARLIDAVYVSTDDPAIRHAALAAGAQVIDRPAELSGDAAGSEAALLHALEVIIGVPDVVVFLQATSPFIDPGDLDAAISRVLDGDDDVVFAARRTHAFLWRHGDAGASGVNHDARFRLRRQDSEEQFQETGAFYVMRADGFREARFRFFGRVGIALVPDSTAIEIDSADDLEMARIIAPLNARLEDARLGLESIDVDAVVTDFDGVHTDDRVHVASDGTESITASRSDGMGVELLRKAGVPVLILSKETNPVVTARAAKLRVEVLQSVEDKGVALAAWASGMGIDLDRVAYLGNDINDLPCFDVVGWPIAVADAHPEVLAAARVVLTKKGGDGAVRQLADRVLLALSAGAAASGAESSNALPSIPH